MFAATSVMIFDSPRMSVPVGLSIIFVHLSVALSVPFALYRIWSRYSREYYQKSRRSCLIPIGAIGVAIAYNALVDVIQTLVASFSR